MNKVGIPYRVFSDEERKKIGKTQMKRNKRLPKTTVEFVREIVLLPQSQFRE